MEIHLNGSPRADGGLLIYLHEAGLDSRMAACTPVVRKLAARGVNVVIPELPGHGERRWPGGYSAEEHRLRVVDRASREVGALLDRFGAAECAVVGGSLGGLCAVAAAVRDPRVRRVCSFLAPLFWPPSWTCAGSVRLADCDPRRNIARLLDRDMLLIAAENDRWGTLPVASDGADTGRWATAGGTLATVLLPGHGHRQSEALASAVLNWYSREPS